MRLLTPGCEAPKQICASECVDTATDPRHCGECGAACPLGDLCEAAKCKVVVDCTQTPCTGFSYCDLASKKCLPGCLTNQQCAANQACNVQTHQCDCLPAHHLCGGVCVPDDSPASCGASCSACPSDPNGNATCSAGQCGLACKTGYHVCANACVSNTSTATCGTSCTPCSTPSNGQATCNGSQCGISCNAGFNACSGQCVANSVQSCGPSCTVCPTKTGTKASCVANKCLNECLNGVKLGPISTLIQTSIAAVSAGDVTGDGFADVIVTDRTLYKLLIYPGSGSGAFQPVKGYDLGFQPESHALGDFNGDGKLDVIVGGSNLAHVWLSGATSLVKTTLYEGEILAVGDFNGDGKRDVVTSGGGTWAQIFLGNGTGDFTYKANVTVGSDVDRLGAADFTGDGRDDVIAAGYDGLAVAASLPDGSTAAGVPTALAAQQARRSLGYGDFNGDGKRDVVTNTPTALVTLLGNGNGTFQSPVPYAEDFINGGTSLGVGDFNGDGKLDVAYPGNLPSSKYLRMRLGTGTGTLGALVSTTLGTSVPTYPVIKDIAAQDFNGDGLSDIALEWGGARVLLAACN